MKILLPLFILFSTITAFSQTNLPDKGSLADIKGKTKIYISADAINSKYIESEIVKHKSLSLAKSADTADFFIEYKSIETTYASSLHLPIETGQIDVYFFRDKKKVIVWSKGDTKGNKGPAPSLLKQFLKEFEKK